MTSRFDDESGRLAALRRYDILDTGPEEEFDLSTELARAIFAVPMAAIVMVDGARQWFKSRPGLLMTHSSRETAFCDHTIRAGSVMVVEDASKDPRFFNNPFVTGSVGVRSYMGAPLTTPDGYNLGAFCILDTIPRDFSEVDREVIANLGKLTMAHMEMRLIASEDSQTGAVSTRSFMNALDQELEKHRRYQSPSTLVVFDIDNLREVSASHGMKFSDAVVTAAAHAVLKGLRKSDTLGRLGGDEFGVLLTGTEDSDAYVAAERFRKEIEACRIPENLRVAFTASFGILPISAKFETSRDWLKAAQTLVGLAKDAGRNRSVAEMREAPEVPDIMRGRLN